MHEINICLDESFNYYYRLLYNQGIRIWSGNVKKINDNIIEHMLTRYNEMLNLKLKEVNDIGVIVSCIIYSNYNLSKEEQILNGIDYINEFGFNIDRDVSLNVEL